LHPDVASSLLVNGNKAVDAERPCLVHCASFTPEIEGFGQKKQNDPPEKGGERFASYFILLCFIVSRLVITAAERHSGSVGKFLEGIPLNRSDMINNFILINNNYEKDIETD